ncbi:Gr23a, partial [Drosophila busckii]
LKRRYAELHLCFEQLNEKSGSSLLLLFIVFFMDFVFNAYWMMMNMLTSRDYKQHLWPHVGVLFNLGMLLTATCWHCQQSYNHSRHIGCLISKLVKPLGSKRYNDLVCEFLLQTLHQRFVVTAKDFFSLNLHLLSSMFAAVVTYLVILIQFMFAERGYKNRTN